MSTKLVCYSLQANPSKRTQLHKELYGYQDFSNHGRYKYKRQGLLQKIKGQRIIDAVIIVAEDHAKELIDLLKNYEAKVHVFEIIRKVKL